HFRCLAKLRLGILPGRLADGRLNARTSLSSAEKERISPTHNIRLVRSRTATGHAPLATTAALIAHLAGERQPKTGAQRARQTPAPWSVSGIAAAARGVSARQHGNGHGSCRAILAKILYCRWDQMEAGEWV